MNLMDMLSGEGDEPMYRDSSMSQVLNHAAGAQQMSQTIGTFNGEPGANNGFDVTNNNQPIDQPENGVYFFPTVLTPLQKDIIEMFIKVFGPEFVKEISLKRLRTRIHSLLGEETEHTMNGNGETMKGSNGTSETLGSAGSNEMRATEAPELSFNSKVDFLLDQIQVATNHPSLLVDHFLPKKLLLLEVNERLISMSGKFQLFNRMIDSLIENFFHSVKFKEMPVYNMLVVADSVKELELIEGLIIGKELYYKNVSVLKLYDDNRGIPPNFNQPSKRQQQMKMEQQKREKQQQQASQNLEKPSDSENEYKRRKTKSLAEESEKYKPVVCLHLITSLQLYNNYTSILDPSLQFKLIVSFDMNLDSLCPSIELIRNQSQGITESDSAKIPIIIPVPLFSINHIQCLIPKPSTNSLNRNDTVNWKCQVLNTLIVNRFNLYDEDPQFFINTYGSRMEHVYDWLLSWDSVKFPIDESQFMGKYNDKLITHFNDDRLMKKLEKTYLIDINDTKFEGDFTLPVFNYQTVQAKISDLLFKRLKQIEASITKLKQKLPQIKVAETLRQLSYDRDEELIADNYRKLKRLNEDANFIDRKHIKVDHDITKLADEKRDLEDKVAQLTRLQSHEHVDAKLKEQEDLISQMTKDQANLDQEYEKLTAESETVRSQYQDSSNEALQLSVQIKKLQDKNSMIEDKSMRPGMRTLPLLIKKDDLHNQEQLLAKLTAENDFLTSYFDDKLDKLINERRAVMDHSGRSNNRVSRASTPF